MVIQRLVVGVDDSEGAQRAVLWSAELAAALDAEVVAVHVVPESWLIEINALQVSTKELVAGWRAKLVGDWTEPFRQHHVRYTTEFLRGDPSAGLLGIADQRHADAIVIGGTHHKGLRGALLGITAHRVVNRSAVPVLVVPNHVDRPEPGWVPIPG